MKKIIVSKNNAEKIESAISAAQGKARVRTISFITVSSFCESLEKRFERTNNKKAFFGSTFMIDHNYGTFPKSYTRKGTPESTKFTLVYDNYKFYLTDVKRSPVWTKRIYFTLSDSAKNAIANAFIY